MKTFEHYKNLGKVPPWDPLNWKDNWAQFNDDPRTQNLDLHLGNRVDFGKIRNDKINVHMWGEWPNSWFNGKTRGQNAPHNLEIEKRFDYVLSFCKITCLGRGYLYAPLTYDYEHVSTHFPAGWGDGIDVNKDIDVFMCATWAAPPPPGQAHNPLHSVVWPWYQIMKKFNHVFCNQDLPGHRYPWLEKQALSLRSKISIVFGVFIGSTPECRTYAQQHYPWIKFKTPKGIDNVKPVFPHPKARIMDAAITKSIILCYKDPFVGGVSPYCSAIEDTYKLEPGVDFIYFEDSIDLEKKIKQILDDYDNPKYQHMVDSAYKKMKDHCDMKTVYENYLVPLAQKGKKISMDLQNQIVEDPSPNTHQNG
ncbi:MAG: hypothetical protein CMB80_09035 [Flammeovirgaceae bacterium]|nr:hypothetical protein [Flammeovirgaceae bacterium]|tara:strand:+ start:100 stop:1191 length:1092 start_codon:yes stop_codon:yes gene_type:complete